MLFDVLVAFGGNGDDHRPARLAFLQIGNHFVVHRALRRNGDDGESLVDERNRAMFHFAGRIRLGMQIADLLQLERAFVADGGAHAASDEERVVRVFACARGLLDCGLALGENALDLLGGVRQLAEQKANLVHAQLALRLREQHREKRQAHHLAQKRLRGRHGDFLVCLRVDDAVGLARHRASHHVRDAEHAGALHARVTNGRERIGRLARLRHRDHERRRSDDGVAVAKLACDLAFGWNARPTFDEVLRDEARVIARAARDDVHAVDEVELLGRQVELVDGKRAVHEPSGERVADDTRLLVDLLQHKVGVAALFGQVNIPIDMRHRRGNGAPRFVGVPDAGRRQARVLAVA